MYQNKLHTNRTKLLTTDTCQAILYVYQFRRSIVFNEVFDYEYRKNGYK